MCESCTVSHASLPGLLAATEHTPDHPECVPLCDLQHRWGWPGLTLVLGNSSQLTAWSWVSLMAFFLWVIQRGCNPAGSWCHFPALGLGPWALGWLPREEWLLSVLDMGAGLSLPSATPSSALQADVCPDAVQPSRAKVMELGKAEKGHHTPPPQHTQCL